MPPKIKSTKVNFSEDELDTHKAYFTRTYRASRTLREIAARVEQGVAMPAYDYPSGDTRDICLNNNQREALNRMSDEDAQKLVGRNGWSHLDYYHDLVSRYGEMTPDDTPEHWDIYALMPIHDHHVSTIRIIKQKLDDAIFQTPTPPSR